MQSFTITNLSDGNYLKCNLASNKKVSKLIIKSFFIQKSLYTSNPNVTIIRLHSKYLSKYLNVDGNTSQSDLIYSFGLKGLTTENERFNDEIVIHFTRPILLKSFADFTLKDIQGSDLDLTTNSVRFNLFIQII